MRSASDWEPVRGLCLARPAPSPTCLWEVRGLFSRQNRLVMLIAAVWAFGRY